MRNERMFLVTIILMNTAGSRQKLDNAIFQTALQHQHQISAQGGTEKIQYYVSASYMDQDGTIMVQT